MPTKTLTDQELLRLRALRQFKGVPIGRLATMFGLGKGSARRLCEYTTRPHLEPTRDDLPPEAKE